VLARKRLQRRAVEVRLGRLDRHLAAAALRQLGQERDRAGDRARFARPDDAAGNRGAPAARWLAVLGVASGAAALMKPVWMPEIQFTSQPVLR